MILKNFLLVVRDMERSKAFYKSLFDLEVVADFGEKVILTQRLVLQEQRIWEESICQAVCARGNDAELYFEEDNLDTFMERLEQSEFAIAYLNPCTEREWGQRMIRIYDPDGHVIEVGESPTGVERRKQKTDIGRGNGEKVHGEPRIGEAYPENGGNIM